MIVIKIGGALVNDADVLATFWTSVAQVQRTSPVVVVHGGGPQATAMARRLGHEPTIVQGRRVTGDLDLEIMQWTLRGALNSKLVAQASALAINAVGLCGADGGIVNVTKRPPWDIDGERVDFGWVGDIVSVDASVLHTLLDGGFTPVVAPLGIDESGQLYNVNADTVAQGIAQALGAEKLLLVTESGGLRRVAEDPDTLMASCDATTYAEGLEAGWIHSGMRVKLKVAFDALHSGIGAVYICAPDDLSALRRATRVV